MHPCEEKKKWLQGLFDPPSYYFCKGLRKSYGVGKAHLIKGPYTNLPSNCIIFICLHVARSTIFIRFPDKDVFILLLHFIQNLAHMILFGTGAGNKRRLMNVKKSCKLTEMTCVTFCLHYTLSQVAPLLGRVKQLIYSYHWYPSFSVSWKIF